MITLTAAQSRLALRLALQQRGAAASFLHMSAARGDEDEWRMLDRIGKREIVGYGLNGNPTYIDRGDFPHPAIRFQEETEEVRKIREKEKGDWKNLSLEDKKKLYRFSYCQTLSETEAPSGRWRVILAIIFATLAATNLVSIWIKKNLNPPLPRTFSEEWREKELERLIDLHINPIQGLATQWDYEKNEWIS